MKEADKLLAELRAQDARGQRHAKSRPSQTSFVHRAGYLDYLVERIKKYDPKGEKAHKIANEI